MERSPKWPLLVSFSRGIFYRDFFYLYVANIIPIYRGCLKIKLMEKIELMMIIRVRRNYTDYSAFIYSLINLSLSPCFFSPTFYYKNFQTCSTVERLLQLTPTFLPPSTVNILLDFCTTHLFISLSLCPSSTILFFTHFQINSRHLYTSH